MMSFTRAALAGVLVLSVAAGCGRKEPPPTAGRPSPPAAPEPLVAAEAKRRPVTRTEPDAPPPARPVRKPVYSKAAKVAKPAPPAPPRATGKPRGWRGDGSGAYPDADPVTEWSATKNVIWSTDMPAWSDATPVIVGERIFVTAEPFRLICVRKSDGAVLWQRENPLEKLSHAEYVAAVAEKAQKRHGLYERVKALKQEKKSVDGRLKASPGDEALKKKAKELAGEIGRLDKERQKYPKAKAIKPNGDVGHSCCTPVSDGSTVFMLYNTGLGVAYDMKGDLRWARLLRPVSMGYGQSMSPALGGGVIGIHIDEEFYGVDLATGRTLWTGAEVQHQGSPVAVKVGGMHVFVTTHGNIRRASDGKILRKIGFPALMKFNTPIVTGSTVWFIGEDKFLVKVTLSAKGVDDVEMKRSLKSIPRGVYYASALVHEGVAYLWDKKTTLKVIDLSKGKGNVLFDRNLKLGGTSYPSPTAAGKYVFVAGDGGTMGVYEPTWRQDLPELPKVFELKEVGRNMIEHEPGKADKFRATPVFEGKRMYLRCFKKLYCIGEPEAK